MKKYFIRLDVQKPTDTDYIQVIKQDTLANTLYITLLNAGELIPMSEFTFVEVVADKPDATQWISSGEVIGDGQIKIDLEYQAISAVGVVDISVKLYTGEVVMTTYPFQLRVIADPNTGTDGSVESSSEYPVLTTMASNETGRLTAEAGRVTSESGRVTAEGLRVLAEDDREAQETARANAEAIRITQETARESAEAIRDTAEGARATSEGTRNTQETARETAEGVRDTNEGVRLSQEAARVTAESQRVTAEVGRTTAEGLRNSAETSRVNAEGSRVTAESGRVSAEVAREAAEGIRDTSYVAAEATRDTQYDTAETARDTQYDTAEGVRNTQYNAAEGARDTLYTGAEGDRDTLYNTAEASRETSYQQAEDARDALTGDLSGLTTTDKTSVVNAINELDADKVDKVAGKGLSAEDYTSTEKTKLAGIEDNAKDDQNASEVPYSNATSGLTAEDTQGAIDEVNADLVAHKADIGLLSALLTTAKTSIVNAINELFNSKANKAQETFKKPTLLNGWVEDTTYPVGYMKDDFGFVHFKGMLKGGTTGYFLELPTGYRPSHGQYFTSVNATDLSKVMAVLLLPTGKMYCYSLNASSQGFFLDNIIFKAV